jgi:hypothetical protein
MRHPPAPRIAELRRLSWYGGGANESRLPCATQSCRLKQMTYPIDDGSATTRGHSANELPR